MNSLQYYPECYYASPDKIKLGIRRDLEHMVIARAFKGAAPDNWLPIRQKDSSRLRQTFFLNPQNDNNLGVVKCIIIHFFI